jgi:hypothetical protein
MTLKRWAIAAEPTDQSESSTFDKRIRGYATGTGSTLDSGCNVLVQPFFFERKDWIA